MISDFDTNTIYFSERLTRESRFRRTSEQLISTIDSFGATYKLLPATKDIWARDFMPIPVNEDKFIEYRYDPDYLQGTEKGRRDLKTYPDIVCDSIGLKTIKCDIILDGGNVVKSSNAIILTDKVVKENRYAYTKKKLLDELQEQFEVDKVVLIPQDPDCEFGHADGMLRFLDEETVLVSGFYETADLWFKEKILKSLRQHGLRSEWLRSSIKKEKEENIAYINYLQTRDLILVPKLNRTEDDLAFQQLCKYFSEYHQQGRIAQIDVRDIFRKGGALNCISWTIKE